MAQSSIFQIDSSRLFPHLSRAPIAEAVIEIRALGENFPLEEALLAELVPKLTDYPKHNSAHGFASEFQFQSGHEPKVSTQDLGWQGLHFTSSDGKQIVKFQKDLFSFSRLQPYENWQQFAGEALRLWAIHLAIARPSLIQRLGVRFINRIGMGGDLSNINKYFKVFYNDFKELNLTLGGFLHQDVVGFPGQPYMANIIRTVQPSAPAETSPALILDLDVYVAAPFEPEEKLLKDHLEKMDWLKNSLFYSIITEKLKEELT